MGKLYVVATPIGNLSDISKRGVEILNSVDIIACEDTRTSSVLLNNLHINKKLTSYHKFNEKEKSNIIIEELLNDKNVALISDAGCPTISDPGSILVRECIKHNIEVISVPGASAITSSIMVSGMDTHSFSFYGFLERKKIEDDLDKIKKDSTSVAIIYESPKRIIKTLNKIKDYLDNPYICLCNDLTKKFEKKYYGVCSDVINMLMSNDKYELGEYVILIEKKEYVKEEISISNEALIIDEMIKNNCTMKDAIKIVSEKYNINKNIVTKDSLHIKKMFNM